MTEINEFTERWNAVRTDLKNIEKQIYELMDKQREIWKKQDELHREGMEAGFKLNTKEMKWREEL